MFSNNILLFKVKLFWHFQPIREHFRRNMTASDALQLLWFYTPSNRYLESNHIIWHALGVRVSTETHLIYAGETWQKYAIRRKGVKLGLFCWYYDNRSIKYSNSIVLLKQGTVYYSHGIQIWFPLTEINFISGLRQRFLLTFCTSLRGSAWLWNGWKESAVTTWTWATLV